MDTYYTPEEVAKILKVSEKVVGDWLRAGIMPGTKTGRLWRIAEKDLENWLEANTQRPDPNANIDTEE